MKKVVFLNNWGDSPSKCLDRYRYQTPNHDCIWEDICGVSSINDADYYVVLDGYTKHTHLDLSKIIYFQREPPVIVPKHPYKGQGALFRGTYNNHYHVATWQIKLPFDELVNLQISNKQKLLSTVTSNKTGTKAQKQRIKIVNSVKKIIPNMDFFGRGFNPLNQDGYCKRAALIDYRYSIACENCSLHNYFTEKIIDCILCWAKPIYWGCPNIEDFLPDGSYATVDIFHKDVIDMIIEEINKPVDYEAMNDARNLILNKYNIWPSIKKIIDEM